MECPKRCKKSWNGVNRKSLCHAGQHSVYVMLQVVLIKLLVFYMVFNSYRNDDRLSIL
jgi:hypothetical protein